MVFSSVQEDLSFPTIPEIAEVLVFIFIMLKCPFTENGTGTPCTELFSVCGKGFTVYGPGSEWASVSKWAHGSEWAFENFLKFATIGFGLKTGEGVLAICEYTHFQQLRCEGMFHYTEEKKELKLQLYTGELDALGHHGNVGVFGGLLQLFSDVSANIQFLSLLLPFCEKGSNRLILLLHCFILNEAPWVISSFLPMRTVMDRAWTFVPCTAIKPVFTQSYTWITIFIL